MPDEKEYKSYLLDYSNAMQKLGRNTVDALVVGKAYQLWLQSAKLDEAAKQPAQGRQTTGPGNVTSVAQQLDQ